MNYLVTGLISSGKSTLLEIARGYNFEVYKSDDIVEKLYKDDEIAKKLRLQLCIESEKEELKESIKVLFLESKIKRKVIEDILHPHVHQIIKDKLAIKKNCMIELPPITNNNQLFASYKTIFISTKKENRIKRFNLRNSNNINFFNLINNIQIDFEAIKTSCDIVINNDGDAKLMRRYFDEGKII